MSLKEIRIPQSLSNVLIHATFSTKHRNLLLHGELQSDLNGYIGSTMKEINWPPIVVKGVEDHILDLYKLPERPRSRNRLRK